jgi:hypothetical protein
MKEPEKMSSLIFSGSFIKKAAPCCFLFSGEASPSGDHQARSAQVIPEGEARKKHGNG